VLYVQEVVRHLRITRQHVTRLIEDGSLGAINVNIRRGKRNCWRIPVEAFDAFLKKRGDGL
jgi:excisionase family DNA binding protein